MRAHARTWARLQDPAFVATPHTLFILLFFEHKKNGIFAVRLYYILFKAFVGVRGELQPLGFLLSLFFSIKKSYIILSNHQLGRQLSQLLCLLCLVCDACHLAMRFRQPPNLHSSNLIHLLNPTVLNLRLTYLIFYHNR